MKASQVQPFFFFCNEPICGPIANKKLKLWRLPKKENSVERWSASPFGPAIEARRGELQAKRMGLKQGAIGNTLGEHIGNIGNILRTSWKFIGNLKGTCWEQRKNLKKSSPRPPQNLKEKTRHCECMLSLPIGCMKFPFRKLLVTIFGLD